MKFLTTNDASGKLSTSRDPCWAAPIRPEFKLVIYEFAWPIYKFEFGNSDFRETRHKYGGLVCSFLALLTWVILLPLGFSKITQIDQRKNTDKPRQSEINSNTITNSNKCKVYTNTVLQSVLVNFSAVSDFQVHQHSMSFVLNVVLMWSHISSNNVPLSDLQPCCSMASMCSRGRLRFSQKIPRNPDDIKKTQI